MSKSYGKKHTFSKLFIIVLSLLLMFSGLGIFYAGRKTEKKEWVIFGVAYIGLEWIPVLLTDSIVGGRIATVIYIISILHTLLICKEYERRLNGEREPSQHVEKKSISFAQQKQMPTDTVPKQESVKAAKPATVEVKRGASKAPFSRNNEGNISTTIPIGIGSASVIAESRNHLKIKISDDDGRVYTFASDGNDIVSFKVGAGREIAYSSK